MIGVILVVLVDLLREERHSIANEEVGDVQRQRVVDAALAQPPVDRRVVHYRNVVVSEILNHLQQLYSFPIYAF